MKLQYWEYNVLQINHPTSPKLEYLTKFLTEKSTLLEGDYVEIGVFQGKSFLSIANSLAELPNSIDSKKCWAYDTFTGFPDAIREDPRDNPLLFDELYADSLISSEHMKNIKRLRQLRAFTTGIDPSSHTHQDLASNRNFDGANLLAELNRKIAFLGLNNCCVIQGDIEKTLFDVNLLPKKIFCALLDVDLFRSYEIALQKIWPLLVPGGRIFLDEYYSLKYPGARICVDEFVASTNDSSLINLGITGDFERWCLEKL